MTALTKGYIYFIESEAAQQNWLTDPENIDIDNFTEGIHYCAFKIPKSFTDQWNHGIKVSQLWGGAGYKQREGRSVEKVRVQGLADTRANAHLFKKFCFLHRTGTTKFYIIVKFATNDYLKYYNATETEREYARCEFKGPAKISWQEEEALVHPISVSCEVLWD